MLSSPCLQMYTTKKKGHLWLLQQTAVLDAGNPPPPMTALQSWRLPWEQNPLGYGGTAVILFTTICSNVSSHLVKLKGVNVEKQQEHLSTLLPISLAPLLHYTASPVPISSDFFCCHSSLLFHLPFSGVQVCHISNFLAFPLPLSSFTVVFLGCLAFSIYSIFFLAGV